MVSRKWMVLLASVAVIAANAMAGEGNVGLPRFPSISPDGQWVAFSWRGDLWKVPADGGTAVRLTNHPGNDLRSAWNQDGSLIAFDSDRDGTRNLYVMNVDGTDIRQVTMADRGCVLAGFGVDRAGEPTLLFACSLEGDVYRDGRPYEVSLQHGGELVRVHDAFGRFPVMRPWGDTSQFLFTRHSSSLSRRHYRGPDARDVWLYDRDTKAFTQLTTWTGNDAQAQWGGGGENSDVLYLSDREHNCMNLYRMRVDRGGEQGGVEALTQFTEFDVNGFDVSADGSRVVLMAWDTMYVLDLDADNDIRPLTITAPEDDEDNFEVRSVGREVSEAALSPDGQVMALVAYGEVYVRNVEDLSPTRRVTESHAREREIVWSPDGVSLYFVSDEDGSESIYRAVVDTTRGEVKQLYKDALKPPVVEEEADEEEEGESEEAEAETEAAEAGDEVAAVDEVEAADAEGDDDGAKETEGEEEEAEEELPPAFNPERWHDALTFRIEPVLADPEVNVHSPSPSPDGTMLAYRRGLGALVVRNLDDGTETALVDSWDGDVNWVWSGDSKWLAYQLSDMNYNADIWIAPADGSADAVNVTKHPDNDEQPRWSADGKILSFLSEREGEQYDVWMVYLDRSLEALTAKELQAYYDEAAKAAGKREPIKPRVPEKEEEAVASAPSSDGSGEQGRQSGEGRSVAREGEEGMDFRVRGNDGKGGEEEASDEEGEEDEEPVWELALDDLDDAYLRVRRVTSLPGDEGNIAMSPGGEYYVFSGSGEMNDLYSMKWDGSDRKRIGSGRSRVQHLTLGGDKVVLVSGGQGGTVRIGGGETEYVSIDATMRIDLAKQSSQKFLEAARALNEIFYHPTMKGLDWELLTARYHALAQQARTGEEFEYIANRFIGELNASHLGIYAPGYSSENAQSLGRLGTVHWRSEAGYEVVDVIPESPAATGDMPIEVGDVIVEISGESFGPGDTVESKLKGLVGDEVVIKVMRSLEDGRLVELPILITPISYGQERNLRYDAWVHGNQRTVDELSGGRIGYIHIRGMNEPSLNDFERDLYAAAYGKDGLIVDVRNNGGGWTTDRLLASIMERQHSYTLPKGADPSVTDSYPQDRLFIQSYRLPMSVLCNEKSFSNAEIFAHAFKTLERGTLVGEQTYGGVISTGGMSLIDGTFVRLPLRGWFLPDGTDMENHGAMPDIRVPQTPEAESRDEDEQLQKAVEELVGRL
ncbi:MAG: peptidase S41 [Planctomycetes bacterium]|nr:peptidase S41 [Planctomycetota bacterium]